MQQHNNPAFIGLLIYLSSYVFLGYYTLWILIGIVDSSMVTVENDANMSTLQDIYQNMFQYFPDKVYRCVFPGTVFGILTIYVFVIFIMRQVIVARANRK